MILQTVQSIMRKRQRPSSLSTIDHQSIKRVKVSSDQSACTPPCTDHAPPTPRSEPSPKNSAKRRVEDWLEEVITALPSELPPTDMSAPQAKSSRTAEGPDNESSIYDSQPTSMTSGSQPKLVELSTYREFHLGDNQIFYRDPNEEFPEHVQKLVQAMMQDRSSPGPSADMLRNDKALIRLEQGVSEDTVSHYLASIFPHPDVEDILALSRKQPMSKYTAPISSIRYKISNPCPDLLYGYDRTTAFSDARSRSQLISLGAESLANNDGLTFPFFAVELKGSRGNIYVATNQVLGASASCVHMVEQLQQRLQEQSGSEVAVDSTMFSAVTNGSEARLFISWKEGQRFLTQRIGLFLLPKPEDYCQFRSCIRNILDWGKGKRLDQIRTGLDHLILESNSEVRGAVRKRRQTLSQASSKRRSDGRS